MTSTDKLQARAPHSSPGTDGAQSVEQVLAILRQRARHVIAGALVAGLIGLGGAFLWPPTYTARVAFLAPQQQQVGAAAALASLGSLAGLAGGAAGIRSSADQYVALMQSVVVSNRIIDRYKLIEVYASKFRVDAQKDLAKNVRFNIGKKDGIISVEVDDESQERSAQIANSYVDELRVVINTLAVTEAQQRRLFFEQQLQATRDKLTQAQIALQATGINAGALKAEPKAAAENYARLRAELTGAEMKLQAVRRVLTDSAPEVSQQQALVESLRVNLAGIETSSRMPVGNADYISRYREFKYQETLFEMFARQYELARVDESREGGLIQVVDIATPPERRSKPKRSLVALGCTVLGAILMAAAVVVRERRSGRGRVLAPA